MPIYKNVARRIAVNVRVTGGATPYALSTWANDATAKMYYSKDGAAATAITPTRIEATIGGWELAVGTLTSTVWNCDELRIWWEGSGIDFGEVVFYPEADYSSTKAGFIDSSIAAVQSDTDNIQTRLPASLVSGRIDASVGAVANDAMTAAGIASDFSTEVATGVWALSVRSLSSHGVAAIWDALLTGITTASSIGKLIKDNLVSAVLDAAGIRSAVGLSTNNLDTQLSGIQSDTNDIQTRIPTALVGGKMDSNVGSMDTGVITATAIAANAIGASELASDAVAEIADAVWDEVQSGHTTAGTFGKYLDAQVSTVGGGSLTAADIADAVWDEAISGHLTAGSTGNALNAAGSAGDPWSTPIPGAYGAGTAGKILGDNINATISSRASQTSVDTVDDLLDTEVAAIKADTAAIKLKTDALPSDPADASDIAASFSTVNTKLDTIDDLLDTEIGTIITAVAAVQADTDNIQTRLPNALVGGKMDSNVGSMDNGVVTAAAIATDAIDNDAIAANAVTEIQSGLATAAELALTKAAAQAAATAAGQIG